MNKNIKKRIGKDGWLLNLPVAHRGLWGKTDFGFVAENSLPAYRAAANRGIPIETDLYISSDGVLYCFHDDTLDRTTNGSGFIYDKSSKELNSLILKGTENERIPRFTELLKTAEGKCPLLIELKNQPAKGFVESVVNALKNYRGVFAVQSFVPAYLLTIKKLAPEFLRGVLGTENAEGENALTRFVLKNMPFNRFIKPDFISYRHTGLPLPARKRKNIPVLAWTVTDEKTEKKLKGVADNIIYELFTPEKYGTKN